jgi:hypothetical protein
MLQKWGQAPKWEQIGRKNNMHGIAIRVITNYDVLINSCGHVTTNNTFTGYALAITSQSVLVKTQTVGISLSVLISRKIPYMSR